MEVSATDNNKTSEEQISNHDKFIDITPISAICNPVKRVKETKNGILTQITCYKDFREHLYFSKLNACDAEVLDGLTEAKKLCYTKGEIIRIHKQEITPFIQKKFRYVEPFIYYEQQDVPIPPYILGIWLGDGNSASLGLTNIDKCIISEWKQYGISEGLKIRANHQKTRTTEVHDHEEGEVYCYYITAGNGNTNQGRHKNNVLSKFKALNLIENKHIPKIYIENSKTVRTELLAGLIDTDGTLSNQSYEITQKNKQLSDDIVTLAKSLGFVTTIKESLKKCTNSKINHRGIYYRIYISINMSTPLVNVRCERKKHDVSTCKNVFNYKFDFNGDVLYNEKTNQINWDESLHLELVSIVLSFRSIESNQMIPWSILHNFNNKLPNYKSDALRKQYQMLEKNTKYYNELKARSTWVLHNPIEPEWMIKYSQVYKKMFNNFQKDKLQLRKVLSPDLENWFHSQQTFKKNQNMYTSKIQLLDLLNNFKICSTRSQIENILMSMIESLKKNETIEDVVLLNNDKLYVPLKTKFKNIGTCLNNLKSILQRSIGDEVIFDTCNTKNEIMEKFSPLLDEYHLNLSPCRTTMIIQFDIDKNIIREHDSCSSVAQCFLQQNKVKNADTCKRHISKACKTKEVYLGFYWRNWLEYYRHT